MNQHSLNNIKITMAPLNWKGIKKELKTLKTIWLIPKGQGYLFQHRNISAN